MLEFYQKLSAALESQTVVVATVIATRGSVPREVGAKMLIGADWTYDTIGGGAGEAKAMVQARSLLDSEDSQNLKQRLTIDLTGDRQHLKEGICGGQMQVWLECWQGTKALNCARELVELLQQGQSVQITTPFAATEQPSLIATKTTTKTQVIEPLLTEAAFTELLKPPPLLLIVGAGHVGEALAQVAAFAGFQIAIQDERESFANPHKYPQASLILAIPIEQALQRVSQSESLYIALVTRGYPYDVAALSHIFSHHLQFCYLGMIGSAKRVQWVLRSLRDQGVTDAQLQSLRAPIGLDIGAFTPSEIAVSICAELVQVRRGGSGLPLAQRLATGPKPIHARTPELLPLL